MTVKCVVDGTVKVGQRFRAILKRPKQKYVGFFKKIKKKST